MTSAIDEKGCQIADITKDYCASYHPVLHVQHPFQRIKGAISCLSSCSYTLKRWRELDVRQHCLELFELEGVFVCAKLCLKMRTEFRRFHQQTFWRC